MKRLAAVCAPTWAEFSGYGSRELFEEIAGRPPLRNVRTRRWSCTPQRLRDMAALAESRGWTVDWSDVEAGDVDAAS